MVGRREGVKLLSLRSARIVLAVAVSCASFARAQSKIARVPVDLGAGAVESPLPFDEPVVIAGKIDTTITAVKLWYWIKGSLAAPDSLSRCSKIVPDTLRPAVWNRQRQDADSFHLLAGPFDADTYYVLCFDITRRPTAQQLELFRSRMVARMNVAFRPDSGEPITQAQRERVCSRLTDDFDAVQAIARTGSLLGCRGPEGDLNHLLRIAELNSENSERDLALRTYTAAVDRLFAALDTLSQSSDMKYLLEASRSGAAPSRLVELGAWVQRRSQLGDLAGGEGVLRSGGVEHVIPPLPAFNAWSPADLSSRMASYGPLQAVLDSLQLVLTGMARPSGPQVRTMQVRVSAQLGTTLEWVRAASGSLAQMSRTLASRDATLQVAAADLTLLAAEDIKLLASSTADYQTRGGWHISANIGLADFPRLTEVSPIVGANVYFRAVNRNVPLSYRGGFTRRFSVLVALTTQSLAKNGEREDLIPSHGLVLGAGYRVTDFVQCNLGALALRSLDEDPTVNKKTIRLTPYVGVSLDATLGKLLGTLGEKLGF